LVNVIGDTDDEICTFEALPSYPDNPECISVEKVGNNWKIDVWLFQNGAIRGGI
jgi:hypothetical protein